MGEHGDPPCACLLRLHVRVLVQQSRGDDDRQRLSLSADRRVCGLSKSALGSGARLVAYLV